MYCGLYPGSYKNPFSLLKKGSNKEEYFIKARERHFHKKTTQIKIYAYIPFDYCIVNKTKILNLYVQS